MPELDEWLAQTFDADPDEIRDQLEEMADDLEDDPSVDFDARQRAEEGWKEMYIECTDCEVPMVRKSSQSHHDRILSAGHDTPAEAHVDSTLDRTVMHTYAICPDCGETKAAVQTTVLKGKPEAVPAPDSPEWSWYDHGDDE